MPSESPNIKLSTSVVNISESGVRVLVSARLLTNSIISISLLSKTGEDELILSGTVVWVRPSFKYSGYFDAGIRFIFVSEYNRRTLRDYIMSHVRGQDAALKTKPVNDYMDNFKRINAKTLNPLDKKAERMGNFIFVAVIVLSFFAIIAFFYMLTNWLDKMGLWGLHF